MLATKTIQMSIRHRNTLTAFLSIMTFCQSTEFLLSCQDAWPVELKEKAERNKPQVRLGVEFGWDYVTSGIEIKNVPEVIRHVVGDVHEAGTSLHVDELIADDTVAFSNATGPMIAARLSLFRTIDFKLGYGLTSEGFLPVEDRIEEGQYVFGDYVRWYSVGIKTDFKRPHLGISLESPSLFAFNDGEIRLRLAAEYDWSSLKIYSRTGAHAFNIEHVFKTRTIGDFSFQSVRAGAIIDFEEDLELRIDVGMHINHDISLDEEFSDSIIELKRLPFLGIRFGYFF